MWRAAKTIQVKHKKHDLRQKHYGKNTAKAAKHGKNKQNVPKKGPRWAKMSDLGGQKWTVVGKNDSSRGASYTEAPLHSLVDEEVERKMVLAQQEWTLWWAKMDRGGQER